MEQDGLDTAGTGLFIALNDTEYLDTLSPFDDDWGSPDPLQCQLVVKYTKLIDLTRQQRGSSLTLSSRRRPGRPDSWTPQPDRVLFQSSNAYLRKLAFRDAQPAARVGC